MKSRLEVINKNCNYIKLIVTCLHFYINKIKFMENKNVIISTNSVKK